jgi:hypothetical protein
LDLNLLEKKSFLILMFILMGCFEIRKKIDNKKEVILNYAKAF